MYDHRFLVTTETGSQYLIDADSGTWERCSKTDRSGKLRTTTGEFESLYLRVGLPMVLTGEGLEFGRRLIVTSPVVTVKEFHEIYQV